jgi:hypothetical protein
VAGKSENPAGRLKIFCVLQIFELELHPAMNINLRHRATAAANLFSVLGLLPARW